MLHFYRFCDLHLDLKKSGIANAGFDVISSEVCFNVEVTGKAIDDSGLEKLQYLLKETFEPDKFRTSSFLACSEAEQPDSKRARTGDCGSTSKGLQIVEVGPRQQFTSAWSTNAVSICFALGLSSITRIERSRRYLVKPVKPNACLKSFLALVHDRMTECVYPDGIQSFDQHSEPKGWTYVPVLKEGRAALEKLSKEHGLGYDSQDIDYYVRVFRDELKRDPTTVECFDLAQGNSEHSRHWFFGGKFEIDGETMPSTLFQWVKRPFKENPCNSTIAFKDNSSALRGAQHVALFPEQVSTGPAAFCETKRDYDLTLTVETHNFPCGIAPFPGAETGVGGRIRDGESTGRGSLVVAGIAGYAVGNLHIPAYDLPWEDKEFKYPSNMAPPLKVLIDCSNGASDYGNKFGEPLVCGWTRSCGQRLVTGERFEWVKPIMLSGGIGQMDHSHIEKYDPRKGQLVVKIGGPAYRIGVGGGAASSMVAGDNEAELDFNAVQRGDAEMQQKVNRVVRACVELGAENPILSIHDQGAGGSGNVLKEIAEPAGVDIDLRKMLVGDPSLSVLELWTAEFQENNAVLVESGSLAVFDKICKRERVPYAVVGSITGDGKATVRDTRDGSIPVDVPLEKVLGKMPQKTFKMKRTYTKPPPPLVIASSVTVEFALTSGVLRLLSVCSKRFLTNKVDRSVTGQIAQQQCVGPFQTPLANFAAIAQSPLGVGGGATAIGEQPMKGLTGDPLSNRAMARLAVAESLTNLVWIRILSLDSVKASGNWMWAAKLDGEGPKMYDAAQALSDMMIELGMSIDGGKDSLSMAARVPLPNGKAETAKAPGQVVISAYAPVPDVRVKVTPDLKTRGDGVLLFIDLGVGGNGLGGSALSQVLGQVGAGSVPDVDVHALKVAFKATQDLLSGNLLSAGHDRSDGGLIVSVLEMAFAGRRGVSMSVEQTSDHMGLLGCLFGEAPGLVYEVRKCDVPAVQRLLEARGVASKQIGETRADTRFIVKAGSKTVLDSDVVTLHAIWEETSFQLEREQCAPQCVEAEQESLKTSKEPPYKLTFKPQPTADAILSSSRKNRVAIVRQEGSNGDREMACSFHLAGFEAWDVHMSDLIEGRISLDQFRGAAFVGGFSYADTLDSAKGWASCILFSPALKSQFQAFRERADSFSLGVCNGCQLLALLGWVPGAAGGASLPVEQQPRFIHNDSRRFESRFATVRIEKSAASAIWLNGMEGSQLGVWIAHGEGKCHFPSKAVFDQVRDKKLIPMRYIDDNGERTQRYPFNPNGSPEGIVGLCSDDGRHLAVMPHPERVTVWPWQWPWSPAAWTEGPSRLEASPWLRMFQNVRDWCEK